MSGVTSSLPPSPDKAASVIPSLAATPLPNATADRIARQVAGAEPSVARTHPLPDGAAPNPCWPLMGRQAPAGLNTLQFIRTFVFRMSQAEFAALLGTSQGRVSNWEAEGRFPSFVVADLVRGHGRAICAEVGQPWCDSWFFEVPR